jgi:hypothetical protein
MVQGEDYGLEIKYRIHQIGSLSLDKDEINFSLLMAWLRKFGL